MWPDWAIFCYFGKHSKLVSTIILPKLPALLGNFCKSVKIIHFLVKSFWGNFYQHLAFFIWSHCLWQRKNASKSSRDLRHHRSQIKKFWIIGPRVLHFRDPLHLLHALLAWSEVKRHHLWRQCCLPYHPGRRWRAVRRFTWMASRAENVFWTDFENFIERILLSGTFWTDFENFKTYSSLGNFLNRFGELYQTNRVFR